MKFLSLCILAVFSLALHASASVSTNFTSNFANGGSVPDNDFNGWTDTRTLNITEETGLTVSDVHVTLNISSGWNGDLYGYLVHDSGFAVLLNRVGTGTYANGYGEAGFTGVVLTDTTTLTSIQNYGGSSTAAGPLVGGSYNSSSGVLDTAFDGLSVNGNWTLFLADLSAGDISQVTGWSLEITSVPEPSTWAMIVFGSVFGGWQFAKRRFARQ